MHIMILGWLGDWPQIDSSQSESMFDVIVIPIAHASRLPSSGTSKRRETESTKCSFGCTSLIWHIWHCVLTDFSRDFNFMSSSSFSLWSDQPYGDQTGEDMFPSDCQVPGSDLEAFPTCRQRWHRPAASDSAQGNIQKPRIAPQKQRNINETSTKHQPCFSGAQFLHFVAQGLAFLGRWGMMGLAVGLCWLVHVLRRT